MQLQLHQLKQQIESAKEASVRARDEALIQQKEQLEREKDEVPFCGCIQCLNERLSGHSITVWFAGVDMRPSGSIYQVVASHHGGTIAKGYRHAAGARTGTS